MLPRLLVLASATIIATLGALHLWYTFIDPKLGPRDPELRKRLESVSPVITRQTTMWKAWVGFNASHGLGAVLFGVVYGYLAMIQPAVFFRSWFLLLVGGAFLGAYVTLGRLYWFSTPYRGILLATFCYVIGCITALT